MGGAGWCLPPFHRSESGWLSRAGPFFLGYFSLKRGSSVAMQMAASTRARARSGLGASLWWLRNSVRRPKGSRSLEAKTLSPFLSAVTTCLQLSALSNLVTTLQRRTGADESTEWGTVESGGTMRTQSNGTAPYSPVVPVAAGFVKSTAGPLWAFGTGTVVVVGSFLHPMAIVASKNAKPIRGAALPIFFFIFPSIIHSPAECCSGQTTNWCS